MTLPIASTLRAALVELVRARGPLARALIVPTLLVAVLMAAKLTIALDVGGGGGKARRVLIMQLLALSLSIPMVLAAVSCHRIVLAGRESLPNPWGVHWSRRELAFFGYSLALGSLVAVPRSAAWLVSWHAEVELLRQPDVLWVLATPFAYPISRLSFTP